MACGFWLRGTRSIKMSLMSRRMARVVSSTSAAKTKVQMGSAIDHRGSSCICAEPVTCSKADVTIAQSISPLCFRPLGRALFRTSVRSEELGSLKAGNPLTCFHQMSAPAMATPMLCTKSPSTWMIAPLRLMLSSSPPFLCFPWLWPCSAFSWLWLCSSPSCSCACSPDSTSCQHGRRIQQLLKPVLQYFCMDISMSR